MNIEDILLRLSMYLVKVLGEENEKGRDCIKIYQSRGNG